MQIGDFTAVFCQVELQNCQSSPPSSAPCHWAACCPQVGHEPSWGAQHRAGMAFGSSAVWQHLQKKLHGCSCTGQTPDFSVKMITDKAWHHHFRWAKQSIIANLAQDTPKPDLFCPNIIQLLFLQVFFAYSLLQKIRLSNDALSILGMCRRQAAHHVPLHHGCKWETQSSEQQCEKASKLPSKERPFTHLFQQAGNVSQVPLDLLSSFSGTLSNQLPPYECKHT